MLGDDSFKYELKEVKLDIFKAIHECSVRGLSHSVKWLAELNFSLNCIKILPSDIVLEQPHEYDDNDTYLLAKSFFDVKEYDRCAFWTEKSKSPRTRFLHLYSRYLAGEKKRIEDMTDTSTPPDPLQNVALRELATELRTEFLQGNLDGYGLYLYGIILKKLDLLKEALEVLVEATHMEPMHWGSWLELSSLITDKAKLNSLTLPNHWIKQFFLGHTYLEQQLNDEALDLFSSLQRCGFENSNYILCQIAIAFHNKRVVEAAISTFSQLLELDPYRLDNLDTYSNLLYVKEMRVELAHLAHQACEIDKYRVETCCVIGNYYSLRAEHQKAVVYFQRALKLNPQYLSAWTLMGHEFMEMKNTNAAIQCYRQAIEVNRRDYRAWYGLGQTYEILKMSFYCIYYYKQAQQLRPNDSRMLLALGDAYEKMDRIQDALKCYCKARSVGDIEGGALIKLAKLFERLNESDQALAAYLTYVKECDHLSTEKSELCNAFKYLANAYIKSNRLEEAYEFAQMCLEHEEVKEEGKALLRTIAQKRSQQLHEEGSSMQVQDDAVFRRVNDSTTSQLSPVNNTPRFT